MLRTMVPALFLMCMAAPLWAAETEPFNPDQPFEEALSTTLLRSLLDQALDTLEDHVEITGRLNPDSSPGGKDNHLRFKFYPEGKSKSDQHLTAEGWFRSAPETGQRDWHFRFKLPDDRSKKLPLQFESPL